MPAPHPPEFRRMAVELAREREKPIGQVAKDLGISESCLRNWLNQADVDEGRRELGEARLKIGAQGHQIPSRTTRQANRMSYLLPRSG